MATGVHRWPPSALWLYTKLNLKNAPIFKKTIKHHFLTKLMSKNGLFVLPAFIIGKLAGGGGPFKVSVSVGLCADYLLSWRSTYGPKGKSQRLPDHDISTIPIIDVSEVALRRVKPLTYLF